MKILVVGKNNVMEWPQSVYSALKSLSFDTELFLFNKKIPSYCFMRLFGRKNRRIWQAKIFERKIKIFQPDLIFLVSVFFTPPELFNVLKKYPNIKKIGWTGDRFELNKKAQADYLDVLFCTDYGFLKTAQKFKCKSFYLPLCTNVESLTSENKTLPPLFVGVLNPTRLKYLSACKSKCLLYLKNCPKGQLEWHNLHRHGISHDKMIDLMKKSICPINIGLSANNITGLNFRVFEISACGGLIMVNKECQDIAKCYDIGKEAVIYDTPEDFSTLLTDVVSNPKKYEKIALAGFQRTMKEHTYQKRMEQMFEILKKYKIF